jgi:uncharacterized protein
MSESLGPEVMAVIERVFLEVREDMGLGVDELKAALVAVETLPDDRSGDDLKRLFRILRLLWCRGLEDRETLAMLEERESQTVEATQGFEDGESERSQDSEPETVDGDTSSEGGEKDLSEERSIEASEVGESAAVPTLTPYGTKAPPPARRGGESSDWESRYYSPLSRRLLAYNWRYLRRMRADGPMDKLDVMATVNLAATQGMFLRPIYRRQVVNHVRLLLLVDQLGSMVPFHRYTRDVVETVREDAQLEDLAVFYFQNVPGKVLFRNEKLTQAVGIDEVLGFCDGGTSVLILSDAGAARRVSQIEMKRVRGTMKVLTELRRKTALICWLNPVPRERWRDTSAEMIARLVMMEAMDRVGLSHGIDQLCGNARRKVRTGGRL